MIRIFLPAQIPDLGQRLMNQQFITKCLELAAKHEELVTKFQELYVINVILSGALVVTYFFLAVGLIAYLAGREGRRR